MPDFRGMGVNSTFLLRQRSGCHQRDGRLLLAAAQRVEIITQPRMHRHPLFPVASAIVRAPNGIGIGICMRAQALNRIGVPVPPSWRSGETVVRRPARFPRQPCFIRRKAWFTAFSPQLLRRVVWQFVVEDCSLGIIFLKLSSIFNSLIVPGQKRSCPASESEFGQTGLPSPGNQGTSPGPASGAATHIHRILPIGLDANLYIG